MATEIAELPKLPLSPKNPGDPTFSAYCKQLFAQPSQLLRLNESPVAFRNQNLRELAAHPEVGQSPPAVLDRRSFTVTGQDGSDIFAPSLSRLIANQFFTANPPVHKPVRQVLAPHLMPVSVAALEPLAVRIAAELARELSELEGFDFCSRFAAQLCGRFFGELIGMTPAEERRVIELMAELGPMFLLQKSVSELRAADAAARAYMDLIAAVADRSCEAGENMLLKTMAKELSMLRVKSDPTRAGMVPDSVGLLLASNLLDGFHTAAVAASSAVYLLLMHPAERACVRDDLSLTRAAVHEALRLLSPLTITQRFTLSEIEYAGVRVPAGTSIVMLWAVGNRDPAAFPDPDRFLLTRNHRHETTFGGGVHVCPGRYVADMLARVTIREICRKPWHMSLATSGVEWVERSMLCQLASLPVALRDKTRLRRPGE
jgi:cytochrome P450